MTKLFLIGNLNSPADAVFLESSHRAHVDNKQIFSSSNMYMCALEASEMFSRKRTVLTMRMIVLLVFLSTIYAATIQVPSVTNVSLVSVYPVNTTRMINVTCNACLCSALASYSFVINCFEFNQSCIFFASFPRTYQMQVIAQTRLYFPQRIFPPPSQCCAPNLTDLINKLTNASVKSVNVSQPRCLVVDNNNYLVTVPDHGNLLSRFRLSDLSIVDQTNISGATLMSITYQQGAYYLGRNDDSVLVLNSSSLLILNTITSPAIRGIRDIIFLQDGQMFVLTSPDNSKLHFFNRSSSSPFNYSYMYSFSTVGRYAWPHGLRRVNDSFFYVVTWDYDSIYSYSTVDHLTWTETLVINASVITNQFGSSGTGSHLTIDECDRKWFSILNFGLIVYSAQGTPLANFIFVGRGLFDMIFLDNYVMYLSDRDGGRILRLQPALLC